MIISGLELGYGVNSTIRKDLHLSTVLPISSVIRLESKFGFILGFSGNVLVVRKVN